MEPIQIIGIEELEDDEKGIVTKLVNEYYEKIKMALNKDISVKLHTKKHSKAGKRHKYDMRVVVDAPAKMFEAQESDWDLSRALHKVFQNVEREIQHKFKVDEHRRKMIK